MVCRVCAFWDGLSNPTHHPFNVAFPMEKPKGAVDGTHKIGLGIMNTFWADIPFRRKGEITLKGGGWD